MKKSASVCAALLALCLSAAPASALESANIHPGGPFLYPIVTQPDEDEIGLSHLYSGGTAAAPAAPYSAVWRSFYGAGSDKEVNWDRAYARDQSQWESHSAEYPDRNTLFRLYEIDMELDALSGQLQSGQTLADLMRPRVTLGAVLNSKVSGNPVGACSINIGSGLGLQTPIMWVEDPMSFADAARSGIDRSQSDSRAVLLLDASLRKQLDASGLRIAKTKAYSLRIPDYAHGILFDDGSRQFFQPQFWADRSMDEGFWLPESQTPGGYDYYEECRIPTGASALTPGRLYSLDEVAKDIAAVAGSPWMVRWDVRNGKAPANTGKPVVYLYPEKQTDVSVKLRFDGDLTYTYPAYEDGWNVTAYPDGRIVNQRDGSEHYYLFWEGVSDADWTFDQGFCIRGGDTEAFLREKLPLLGLTAREYNDFITYWVPKMQGNPYNLIKFADTEYDRLASLTVTPKPDTLVRIHMVYKALSAPVKIAPQTFHGFDRTGFTVVEWGGTEAAQNASHTK